MDREDYGVFLERYGGRVWVGLAGHERVRAWIMSYDSEDTVVSQMKYVFMFFEDTGLGVDEFLGLDRKVARDLIWSQCQAYMREEHYSKANQVKYAMKSLYNYFHEEEGSELRFKRREHRVRVPLKKDAKKYVSTHHETYQIVDHMNNLRDKCWLLMMYHTGLGPQAICNFNYGDVRYLLEQYRLVGEQLEGALPFELRIDFRVYPKRFRKAFGVNSYTVLADSDFVKVLILYCRAYHQDSEDNTPLFYALRRNVKERIDRSRLYQQYRRAIQKVSILNHKLKPDRNWPYLIRDVFYNRLVDGRMNDMHREYLMGHNLGVRENYYDKYKDEIKRQYLKCYFNRAGKPRESMEQELTNARYEIMKLREQLESRSLALEKFGRILDSNPEVEKKFWEWLQTLKRES